MVKENLNLPITQYMDIYRNVQKNCVVSYVAYLARAWWGPGLDDHSFEIELAEMALWHRCSKKGVLNISY